VEPLKLTGIIVWDAETHKYASLCPEVNVASMGNTIEEAKAMLLEAAELHVEGAIEDGLSYLRPMPDDIDPRNTSPGDVAEIFSFSVDVAVRAHV
jgi:predicted RNase H-like HicB family nuclease